MVLNISVNFRTANMEEGSTNSQIKMFSWGIGRMIVFTVKESTLMQMANNTRENFKKAKNQEEVSTSIRVVLCMMENGKRIKRMALESSPTLIVKNMKEIG